MLINIIFSLKLPPISPISYTSKQMDLSADLSEFLSVLQCHDEDNLFVPLMLYN